MKGSDWLATGNAKKIMTLIYQVAARDKCKRNSICVRSEIMINREEPTVLYRSYQANSYKQAKLKALHDVFRRFNFSQNESIMIFSDDEQLTWEWKSLMDGDDEPQKQSSEWEELLPYLFRFSMRPQIKDKGCLTTAMRSDMKLHMQNEEF